MDEREKTWDELTEEIREAATELVRDTIKSRALQGLSTDARERFRDDVHRLKRFVASAHRPRIALVGHDDVAVLPFLEEMLGEVSPDFETKIQLGRGRWYDYETARGNFRMLDMRHPAGELPSLKALAYDRPDLLVALVESNLDDAEDAVDALLDAMVFVEDEHDVTPPLLAAIVRPEEGRSAGDFRTQQAIKQAFEERGFARDYAEIVSLARPGRLIRRMIQEIGEEARLPLARLSCDRNARREAAQSLVRMGASLSAAVATVPLPVADMVPITSIQLMMVTGIAYIGGRDLQVRSLAEFLGAMGLSVGAGYAFRELVRAMIRLVPVAGSVVSASIAAGATHTLGLAAIRFFIEGERKPMEAIG